MVTILRADGLRVVIYLNDHEPAHVHVFGNGEAKIHLYGRDGNPRLDWAYGMTRGDIRRAMLLVGERQAYLLDRWRFLHGRNT